MRRRLVLLTLTFILVLVVGFVGAAWYYAEVLKSDALEVKHPAPNYNVTVTAITEATITLSSEGSGDWRRPGTYGLVWPGGYAQIGIIRASDDNEVTRDVQPLQGLPAVGDHVKVDRFAFPDDPQTAFGLPFENVRYSSQGGEFGAWLLAADPNRWAILIHGRQATRAETLRALRPIHELGFTEMAIEYRNDEGAPASEDGYYDFGETEWRDVEGAVSYAIEHGAGQIVLVGFSMGGGASVAFLERSQFASRVSAVVLDAPLTDFGATIDYKASQRNLPGLLTSAGKWLVTHRFGVDWGERNFLDHSDLLKAPILLFQGTDDDTVPVETSDRLAELRPDLVTYVKVEGGAHVGSWNIDPAQYERVLRDFLEASVPVSRP